MIIARNGSNAGYRLKRRRAASVALLGLVSLAGISETGARLIGVADFPLYRPDDAYGYIPAPNQHGTFLGRNRWEYNELSMGVAKKFDPSNGESILLIGDSIVNGGNPVDQRERLGSVLARNLGRDVWPISAGSWALLNELSWMEQNPKILNQVRTVVVISNSADFGPPSVWHVSPSLPRKRTGSAIIDVLNKFVFETEEPGPLKEEGTDWPTEWEHRLRAVVGRMQTDMVIVLYPDHAEYDSVELRQKRLLKNMSALQVGGRVRVIDLGADPRWRGDGLYRDSIHPSVKGTQILADIMADLIKR